MVTWEIRLVDQPPVRVELEAGRNLSDEFSAFRAKCMAAQPPKWKFWARRDDQDLYWIINETTKLHIQMVAAVLICKKARSLKREIGFHAPKE